MRKLFIRIKKEKGVDCLLGTVNNNSKHSPFCIFFIMKLYGSVGYVSHVYFLSIGTSISLLVHLEIN